MTEQPARLVTDVGPFAIVPMWLLTSGVSARAIQVFAWLAVRYANREHMAWPKRSELSADLNCSADTIDRALQELVDVRGLRVKRRQLDDGNYTSNLYQLCFAEPRKPEEEIAMGSRNDAARGGRNDAARVAAQERPGSRKDAATVTKPIEPDHLSQRAREVDKPAEQPRGTLIGRGEGVRWHESMMKHHEKCHPEVCHWRDEAVPQCMPIALVDEFARKLPTKTAAEGVAYVIAWARNDRPSADYVAPGTIYKHWAARWDATHSVATEKQRSAPAQAARPIPNAEETDRLIQDMGGQV